MKYIKLLFFTFLLTTFIKSQSVNENKLKPVGPVSRMPYGLTKVNYPGDSNIDVTYYKLNINVHYIARNISGAVTVEAKSTIDNLNTFFLDLQNVLTVDSVVSNNQKLNFTQPTGSAKLNITLDKAYNIGEKISLIVYYKGTPGSSGFGSFTFGTTGQGLPAIYTLSEPYGASDWWPCKDTPADKADSADIWITCSKDLKAISNGNLMGIIDNGNGTHTYKWKTTYPIAQYLISMAIAPYLEYDFYFHYNSTDSMLVSNYLYPETMTDTNKAILDKTLDMLSIYTDKYGPYPFLNEKYGHAQFGYPFSGGMEHQTITSITSVSEGLIAHELAHQWYGDKITCKNWESIWLNEGFATFSEGLYREIEYGRSFYDSYIVGRMNQAKAAQGTIFVQNISSVNSIFDFSRTYAKGSVVLHMLRGIVGDAKFFNIMKAYAADPSVAYGVAETADFQRVAESIYGSSLDYFFNEWIFGENYPKYDVNWGYSDLGGGQYSVNINVNQQKNSNPVFFKMPIQLKISFGSTNTLVTVINDKGNQTFNITVNKLPTGLTFDPNNYILKDVLSLVTGVEDEVLPSTFTLNQNYPNPFNPNTTISFTIPEKSFVSLVVTDLLGRKVADLVNAEKPQGNYTISFDGSKLSSGIYFYTLSSGKFVQTKKMLLLK